jgi:putative endonuclease
MPGIITHGITTASNLSIILDCMPVRTYYAYIVASRTHALYIGVTGDLERRIAQHRDGAYGGFTEAYHCNPLVWFERYTTPGAAIAREKQLKGWRREKKIELIRRENPTWVDLSEEWGKSFIKETTDPSTTVGQQPPTSAQDDMSSG